MTRREKKRLQLWKKYLDKLYDEGVESQKWIPHLILLENNNKAHNR